MIKLAERNKMRKLLKTGYSKEVQELLEEKGIMNKRGRPYGESFINHVFNGRNENLHIENALIEIYQKRYIESKKIQLERKKIFGTKKPDAGNIG